MIDEKHLDGIRLSSTPIGQKIIGTLVLTPNYRIFRKVDIRFENLERIPRDDTVIFAMSSTISDGDILSSHSEFDRISVLSLSRILNA